MFTMNKFLNVTCFMLTSNIIFAGTSGASLVDPSNCANAYVMTISGGPTVTNDGEKQTFFLQSDIQKTYLADKKTRARAAGEIFLGIQQYIEEGFAGQIGLAVAFSQNKMSGEIWEDAEKIFNDFTYDYKIHNTRYAFKGKFIANTFSGIQAYLSGTAGVGVNRSSNFQIKPKIVEAVPAPSFGSNSEISFSYAIGTGLQKAVTKNIQVGVGYEFADWGRNNLTRAPGQTLNSGLGLSHLYTHELQFSLSFLS